MFLSLSRHNENQLGKRIKKALVRSHFRGKQTNKQINFFFMSKRVQIIVIEFQLTTKIRFSFLKKGRTD